MAFSANYQLFLAQEDRQDRFLAILRPLLADTEAATALYQSIDSYGTKPTDTPPSQRFEAQLMRGFEAVAAIDMPELAGIVPGGEGGRVRITQHFGNLDFWRTGYFFDGRPISILHGGWSQATGELEFADYGEIFDGEINGQPAVGLDFVEIDVRDPSQRLDYPICDRFHRGLSWMLYGDGTNDYVDMGVDAAHNLTNLEWTIEVMLNLEAAPGASAPILWKTNGSNRGYAVVVNADRTVSLTTYWAGPSSHTTTSTRTVTVGRTVTVSFQMFDSGTCRIYFDGKRNVSLAGHTAPGSSSDNLYLLKNSAGSSFLNAFIAEVRIWNVRRSAEEIADCANRTLTPIERLLPELVGYWPCDDGSGATLADASATGADGTISGAVFHRALEGAATLEGERMLEVWGPQPDITAHQVESDPPIWQIHSDKVNGLLFGREGGAPRTVNTPFTSRAAFLAATTAAPTVDVLISAGGTFARAAIPAQKKMTFDVEGDKSDGVYRTSGPDLIRYWLTTRGPYPVDDATEIDDAAFDSAAALDTAPNQLVYDGETMLRQCIQDVARSGTWTVWRDLETKLWTIRRFVGAVADMAAESDPITLTNAHVVRGTLVPTPVRAPAKRVSVYCQKNPTLFNSGDLSMELLDPAYDDLRRFLMGEFSTATANANFSEIRRQAREIFIDSTLALFADGRSLALRERDLWDGNEQGLSFLSTATGLVLDLMRPIYFHYQGEDEFGSPIDRLGTSATSAFIVVARGVDLAQGAIRLTIYREDS